MKKIIALFLSALLIVGAVFALTGCGGKSITGTWYTEIDITKEITEALESEEMTSDDFSFSKFVIPLTAEFKEDGTYTITINQSVIEGELQTLKSECIEFSKTFIEKLMVANGINMSLEDFLSQYMGMTLEEFSNEISESFSSEDILSEIGNIDNEGTYTVNDEEIVLDGASFFPYTLNGNTLVFNSGHNSDGTGITDAHLPWTFTKQ